LKEIFLLLEGESVAGVEGNIFLNELPRRKQRGIFYVCFIYRRKQR
jgi:hypothetical protein